MLHSANQQGAPLAALGGVESKTANRQGIGFRAATGENNLMGTGPKQGSYSLAGLKQGPGGAPAAAVGGSRVSAQARKIN